MLVACWSPKGGSGTTVAAVLLALCWGRLSPSEVVVADVAGDVPAALGLPEPTGPGLADWLSAAPDVGADALARIEVDVGKGLRLLPSGARGGGAAGGGARAEALAALLCADPRPVVADCGIADRTPGRQLAAGATLSLAVLRPCYLALRRALAAPVQPSGILLVQEPGRSLQRRDVEDVLGVPVWAEVPLDANLARAVDAGLLSARVPRGVDRVFDKALVAVAG
ncbi:MAG TPA: hypothetical protein VM390_01605 [Acidimicrobiales bacterium]|jgi:hypothetical protein|nr:hypothetical protein [Acidimicrobiales bacterium]